MTFAGPGAALSLQTTSVGRSKPLPLASRPSQHRQGAELDIDRGTVVETWTGARVGSEQAWHLAQKPAGHGDLVVRVAVRGLPLLSAGADGLLFGAAGGPRIHYGTASFVDARGARTAVSERWKDGEIVLSVPARAVERAAYPAVIDPLVSAEIDVDQPAYSPLPGLSPAVAWGTSNYLAVWANVASGLQIEAARLGADGTLLDPAGISLATYGGWSGGPRGIDVAWAGNAFCVAWTQGGLIQTGAVTSSGSYQAGTYFYLSNPAEIALAGSGNNCQAIWTNGDGNVYQLDFPTLDPTASTPVTHYSATGTPAAPALASDGQNQLGVWRNGSELQGSRLPVGPPFHVASGLAATSRPRIAWNGTQYLVVWAVPASGGDAGATDAGATDAGTTDAGATDAATESGATDAEIVGVRIAADDSVLDAQPFVIAAAGGAESNPDVSAAPTGGFLVGWDDARSGSGQQLYAAQVADDGSVHDPDGHALSPTLHDEGPPSLASSGLGSVVVWSHAISSIADLHAQLLDGAGQPLDATGFVLSKRENNERYPAVTWNGSNYLVAWQDDRSSPDDIYASRVDPSGKPLDPQAIPIVTGAVSPYVAGIASDGTRSLVLWSTYPGKDVHATLVLPTGKIEASYLIASSSPGYDDHVVHVGNAFLVTWGGGKNTELLKPSGIATPITLPSPVPSSFTGSNRLMLASNGSEVLLLGEADGATSLTTTLAAWRIDASGNILDPSGIQIPGAVSVQLSSLQLVSNGSDFLVVWSAYGSLLTKGVVIRADGTLATPGAVTLTSNPNAYGASWDGEDYLLYFDKHHSLPPYDYTISGMRVSNDLKPLDAPPWVVAPHSNPYTYAAASDGQGHTLFVYSRANSTDTQKVRVHARLITELGALGDTCSAGADCDSGHCSDGVCCNIDCGASTTDCQACSVAAGAAKDGTCGLVKSGFECRPAASACDVAESCDGVHTSCPADLHQPDGTACSSGSCVAGTCVTSGIDGGSDATPDATGDADAAGDASKTDSGADSSKTDGGSNADAGDANPIGDAASDATDAGDAASDATDAGDAATDAADAGAARPAPVEASGGCSCRLGGKRDAAPWLDLLLLGVALGSVQRRRGTLRRKSSSSSGKRLRWRRGISTAVLALATAGGCSDRPPPGHAARSAAPLPAVALPHATQSAAGHAAYRVHADQGRVTFTARPGAALSLQTTRFARGRPLPLAAKPSQHRQGAELGIDRGSVVETWTDGRVGSEQAWHLAHKPAGHGDLVVRVAVRGLPLLSAGADGLLFGAAGGPRIRYGGASFVDARGMRTRVGEKWQNGEIVLSVPARAIERAAYPAVIDPLVSPEIDLDQPVYSAAPGFSPAVAWGQSNYLAVWANQTPWDLQFRAARLGADGTLLDPASLLLGDYYYSTGWSGGPRGIDVAWAGNAFCVAWAVGGVISVHSVSSGGVEQTGSEIDTYENPVEMALASDGNTCLVVWTPGSPGLGGATVQASGAGAAVKHLFNVAGTPAAPALASDGQSYLAVWRNGSELQARRLLPVAGATFSVASGLGATSRPRIAWDGTEYLVVWAAPTSSGDAGATDAGATDAATDAGATDAGAMDAQIVGVRIAADDSVLDAQPLVIAAAGGAECDPDVSMAPTGGFLVGWDDARSGSGQQLYAAQVADDGSVHDPDGHALSPTLDDEGPPSLASSGLGSVVVWPHAISSTPAPYAQMLDAAGQPLDATGFPLSKQENEEGGPYVSWNGSNYLVTWTDQRKDSGVYAGRVDPSGNPLDPQAIAVATGSDRPIARAMASDGTRSLVLWSTNASKEVHATLVLPTGQLEASYLIASNTTGYDDHAVHVGNSFLVTWGAQGELLSPSGVATPIAMPAVPPSTPGYNDSDRRMLVSNGSEVLLVGETYDAGVGTTLTAWRIDASGKVIDPSGIQIPGATSANIGGPHLTTNGSDFLLVWTAQTELGIVVRADGTLATQAPVSLAPGGSFDGASWDGQTYLLYFEKQNWPSNDNTVTALRLSADLKPLDAAPWVVTPHSDTLLYAAAGSDTQGHTLFAYDAPSGGTDRIRARLITVQSDLGATCSADTDCRSGHCSDGVCCNIDCGASTTDCQACSVAAGAGKDGTCGIVKSGVECRPAAGACDVAESCDGVHTSCPVDLHQPDGTACSSGSCVAGTCVTPGLDAGIDAASDAADDADAAGDASKTDGGRTDSGATDSGAGGSSNADAGDANPIGDASSDAPHATDASDAATDAADDGAVRPPPVRASGGCGCRLGGERNSERGSSCCCWALRSVPVAVVGAGRAAASRRPHLLAMAAADDEFGIHPLPASIAPPMPPQPALPPMPLLPTPLSGQ